MAHPTEFEPVVSAFGGGALNKIVCRSVQTFGLGQILSPQPNHKARESGLFCAKKQDKHPGAEA